MIGIGKAVCTRCRTVLRPKLPCARCVPAPLDEARYENRYKLWWSSLAPDRWRALTDEGIMLMVSVDSSTNMWTAHGPTLPTRIGIMDRRKAQYAVVRMAAEEAAEESDARDRDSYPPPEDIDD